MIGSEVKESGKARSEIQSRASQFGALGERDNSEW